MKYVYHQWLTEQLASVFTIGFTLIELNLSIKLYFNILQVLYPSNISRQLLAGFIVMQVHEKANVFGSCGREVWSNAVSLLIV